MEEKANTAVPRLYDCPNCCLQFYVEEIHGQGRKEILRTIKEVCFTVQRFMPVYMVLDSHSEAKIIVEYEKKRVTGRSAVTSEWTYQLAEKAASQDV